MELGLSVETARILVQQTALGAAKIALESSESPEQLRNRVTSPGGTTQQAIETFAELGGQADTQLAKLKNILDKDLKAFNKMINDKQLPVISVK